MGVVLPIHAMYDMIQQLTYMPKSHYPPEITTQGPSNPEGPINWKIVSLSVISALMLNALFPRITSAQASKLPSTEIAQTQAIDAQETLESELRAAQESITLYDFPPTI